jgi:hypothetical protein
VEPEGTKVSRVGFKGGLTNGKHIVDAGVQEASMSQDTFTIKLDIDEKWVPFNGNVDFMIHLPQEPQRW